MRRKIERQNNSGTKRAKRRAPFPRRFLTVASQNSTSLLLLCCARDRGATASPRVRPLLTKEKLTVRTPIAPKLDMQPEFVAKGATYVDRVLQYKFRDPLLLEEALTHRSYYDGGHGPCYKRLAFLGDSALYILFAKKFYRKDSTLENKKLTDLRKVYIANKKLARVAVRHNLYELLRHKCPYFDINVSQFTKSVQEQPEGNHGINPPKVLADIVEAIVGAVYVDSNFDFDELERVTMLLFDEETLSAGQYKYWLKGIFTCILAVFFICCTMAAIDFSSDHAIVEISFIVGFAWFCLKILLWIIQVVVASVRC